MLLAILITLMAAFLGSAADGSRASSVRTGRFEIKRSANSVNRLAAQWAWADYATTLMGGETNVAGLRAHLDGLGLTDQAGLTPAPMDVTAAMGLSAGSDGRLRLGDTVVESVRMHREDAGRNVSLFVTSVTTTSEGGRPLTQATTDVFSIEAPQWGGMDFALLANNINCIMCHTNIDDVERVYAMGGAAGPAGPTRTRVGSIESFLFRDDPDSTIAGTLYLGGSAVNEDGDPISDWAALNLKAAEMDHEGKIVQDNFGTLTLENLSPADPSALAPFENLYTNYLDMPEQIDGEMPETFPVPFLDDGGVDPNTGELATTGAGNRVVDDYEFNTTVEGFTGSITGGRIGLSPPGNTIDTAAAASALVAGTEPVLPANTTGNVVLTGTDSNPIRIDGRVAIDGDLIISGPLEGAGSLWVRGNIYVRGDLEYNDVFAGSQRQFGINSNGQTNALGLTAGGNVVIGDIYRPQWGEGSAVDGTDSSSWNFTLEQAAAFNGREWTKTQAQLPGKPVPVEVTETVQREIFIVNSTTTQEPVYKYVPNGTFSNQPVYTNVKVGEEARPVYTNVFHPSTLEPPYDNSWTERVQTGSTMEPIYERQQTGTVPVENTDQVLDFYRDVVTTTSTPYDPPQFEDVQVTTTVWETPMFDNPDYMGADYQPRYYQFGPNDPIPVQNKDGYFDESAALWIMEEGATGWDESMLTLADPNDPSDPILFPAGGVQAAITTLEPTDSWMDPGLLQDLIQENLLARDPNDPFAVDATIYSANSIFGVVPRSPADGTSGAMRVQGALLAADVGLLAPTGLDLFYDERGRDVLDIRDETQMGLRFVGTLPAPLP